MSAAARDARQVLHAEQRRMAAMALAACALLLAVALVGAAETLGYLAPTLALVALLILGRYPGEHAYERRLAPPPVAPRRPPPRSWSHHRAGVALPRGGALLAAGLAGRAPPLSAG